MTRDELGSVLGSAAPARRLLPGPVGYTGTAAQRAQLAYLYAGLVPAAAAPAAFDDGLPPAFVLRDPGRVFTLKDPGRVFRGVPR